MSVRNETITTANVGNCQILTCYDDDTGEPVETWLIHDGGMLSLAPPAAEMVHGLLDGILTGKDPLPTEEVQFDDGTDIILSGEASESRGCTRCGCSSRTTNARVSPPAR